MIEIAPAIDLRLRPPIGAFLSLSMFDRSSGLPARLGQRGYTVPDSYQMQSMHELFSEMDRAAIGRALIVARAPSRLGSVSNVEAAAVVGQYPQRLAGFIGQVSCDLVQARADISEAVDLGAAAVSIEPGLASPPRRADDQTLLPIYDLAAQHSLPVFLTGGDSGPDTTYGSPIALERAAREVPAAAFVAAHGGWPYIREMVAVALRRPNIWVLPDMYAARFPGHAEYIEAANGLLRDRILFGTSYPAVNIEEYVRSLWSDGMAKPTWQAIAVDNPRRLLGPRIAPAPQPFYEGDTNG